MNFRNDYYEILEVSRSASKSTIDTIYRRKRSDLHPDKHSDATPDEIRDLNSKSALLNEAYEVLSSSDTRQKYDQFLFDLQKKQNESRQYSEQDSEYNNQHQQRRTTSDGHQGKSDEYTEDENFINDEDVEKPKSNISRKEQHQRDEKFYQDVRKWVIRENQPMINRVADEFRLNKNYAQAILERMYRDGDIVKHGHRYVLARNSTNKKLFDALGGWLIVIVAIMALYKCTGDSNKKGSDHSHLQTPPSIGSASSASGYIQSQSLLAQGPSTEPSPEKTAEANSSLNTANNPSTTASTPVGIFSNLTTDIGNYPANSNSTPNSSAGREVEDQAPTPESEVPPTYPPLALRRRWTGTVLLTAIVNNSGDIISVKIKKSSGHRILDSAAMKAVWSWRFSTSNGPGVASSVLIPIDFKLGTKSH